MSIKNLNIAITAGEPSGDLLGSYLISALKKTYPNAHFFGIGGPLMIDQGFTSFFKQENLAVMGYFEVVSKLPKILLIRKQITNIILKKKPDIYIGIDAPDFNFKIEQKVHRQGIPTIHYVSPSVWAWKSKRVEKIIQFTDNILCLFPMEPPIYHNKGGNAIYVGHPLANQISLNINQLDSRQLLSLPNNILVATLMPGSRESEIKYMAPLFLETAKQLFEAYPSIQFFMPINNQKNQDLIRKIIQTKKLDFLPIRLITETDNKYNYLAASNVALVASGTATLEVALCKCPMVISYIISPITHHLVKPFIQTDTFGLPNILLQERVVPEYIQENATADNLFKACQIYLDNPKRCQEVIQKFYQLHQTLRQDFPTITTQAISKILHQTEQ
ncbi:MAG: lipid-A-disaccharide synthase [Neisseriaceae bacterium]|nr:MAG: lipid-A-disaccharide synthase [Neisseriaceae bacterium]